MSEPLTNEHGVEIFTRRIFRWDEVDTVHWDDDGLNAQIVTGEHMHLIRATYAPGSTYETGISPVQRILVRSASIDLRSSDGQKYRLGTPVLWAPQRLKKWRPTGPT